MGTGATPSGNDKLKIFETLFSSPGMGEKCKIVLQLSRQNILVLGRLIESGLLSENSSLDDEILTVLHADSLAEFRGLHEEILKKAVLTEFYQRLKAL